MKLISHINKLFILLLLSIGVTSISHAALFDGWSDNQLCEWMDQPSPPEIIESLVNKRKISCNDGIVANESEISINKNSARALKFKKWNKALRGKGPIYSTRSGTNLKIDTFGDEKSITIDRAF